MTMYYCKHDINLHRKVPTVNWLVVNIKNIGNMVARLSSNSTALFLLTMPGDGLQ